MKIFKDLMNDKEAYEYAQSLGIQDGTFKLYLDDSVAVGEKNKMYDALLGFEIGLVNLGGTIERMMRPLEGMGIGMAGPMGYDSETAQIVMQQQEDFAQETREERLERYRT